jgi:hypothetical protein
MFDLRTLKVLGRIPAAEDADAILFDPASNRVFSLNGDSHSSTVIDAVADKLITNIQLGGNLEYGVSAGNGKDRQVQAPSTVDIAIHTGDAASRSTCARELHHASATGITTPARRTAVKTTLLRQYRYDIYKPVAVDRKDRC